jgi:hypothetical protein
MSDERGQVTDATRQAEAEEARAPHVAGEPSTSDNEGSDSRPVDDDVRRHYQEMVELGAEEEGEGRIP